MVQQRGSTKLQSHMFNDLMNLKRPLKGTNLKLKMLQMEHRIMSTL